MLKDQSKLKLLLCINVMIMRKISSFVSNFSFGKNRSVNNGRNCYLIHLHLSIPCHVCFQFWVWSAWPAAVPSHGTNAKEKVRPAWLRWPINVWNSTIKLAQSKRSLKGADLMLTVIKKTTLLVKLKLSMHPTSVTSTAAQATTAMLAQQPASPVLSCCHAPWPLWWCFSKPKTWMRLRSSTAHDQGCN